MKSSLLLPNTVTPSGLMIVGADNQDTLNDARLAILGQVMRAGNALGIQFDQPKKVIDLYAGTPQQQKNIMVKRSFCEPPPEGVKYQINMVGSRSGSYNFCGDEASSNVIPMIRTAGASGEKSVIIFSQTISNASSLLLTTLVTAMTTAKNNFQHPKQIKTTSAKTFCRSPYREQTHVVRVPESLLPTVYQLLDQARKDVEEAAWLDL